VTDIPLTSTPPPPSEKSARLRVRRRNFFLCAAFFSLCIPLQPLVLGRWEPALIGVQVGWTLCFLLMGAAVGAAWVSERTAGSAAALLSLVNLTMVVRFTGNLESPYFPLFQVIPLAIAVFTMGQRGPVRVSIGATLVCLLLILGLSRASPRLVVAHMVIFAFVSATAAYGGRTYWRVREAEQAAQQERLEAVRRLAESERRRVHAERNRAEVERLAVVGQLAAGVAHEINNPLAFVKSNLGFLEEELLREDVPLDREEARQILDETQQGVVRIQQIVADLRQFSRDATAADEECSVEAALEEARRLASVRLRSLGEVLLEVEPDLPRVRVGQRRLVQVLLNLLLNAADALEATEERPPARILVSVFRHEAGVRLVVEDNGPGIPESALPRLFEPFFTTKPPGKGTGLGLALCREYVVLSGGTLTADNRPEGGARFTLTLKAAKAS
jgi:C4-dicarboxylate-specific signal transduction histidine kinase